jgi:hypothetical protein
MGTEGEFGHDQRLLQGAYAAHLIKPSSTPLMEHSGRPGEWRQLMVN